MRVLVTSLTETEKIPDIKVGRGKILYETYEFVFQIFKCL